MARIAPNPARAAREDMLPGAVEATMVDEWQAQPADTHVMANRPHLVNPISPPDSSDTSLASRLRETEARLRTAETQLRHIEDRYEALIAAEEQLDALVIERERLLRDRAAVQARALALQEASRRMDIFLSIASHELRTPMTSMKINIQMAERALRSVLDAEHASLAEYRATAARAHDLLVRADGQFNRQTRLVADLLDATRIKAGKLELRREVIDLAAIIRETVEEHRLAQPEREILTSIAAGPVPVFADADRIGQVLTNYLSNALKYSAEDQPVSVWLRVRGQVAKVSVRDQGPGLPPVEQGRVWKRFYRVENIQAQSGSSVGLGLGLHLCHNILDQHGGQVGLRSAPGRGATFWFTLPLVEDGSTTA